MTPNAIQIGPAPDYKIYSGKQLFHHQATITIKLNDKNPYSQSLSNASMFELAKSLKGKLQVIAWTAQVEPSWDKSDDFEGMFYAKMGEATITYRKNRLLSDRQAQRLNNIFLAEFS